MRWSSGARYAGGSLFVGGTIMLIFAIDGMLPHGSSSVYTSDMFGQFVMGIAMLLVATVMVALGLFLALYGGEYGKAEGNRDRRGD